MPKKSTEPSGAPEHHYVLVRGLLRVGRNERGGGICYKVGDVLPEEIGREEWARHPQIIELRPGYKPPSEPHDPNIGGGMPPSSSGRVQESKLTDADLAAIRRAVQDEVTSLTAKQARHDATVPPETRAEAEAGARRAKGDQ